MSNLARLACFGLALLSLVSARGADWVRAGINTNQPLWGLRGGLLFVLPPGGFSAGHRTGPRGLIRLGYPTLAGGNYDLINFIAIEPVVSGKKGFSELEMSQLDKVPGKRLCAGTGLTDQKMALDPGHLSKPGTKTEQLELTVRVEKFQNGAHVYLVVSQQRDSPDEMSFTVHAEPDSAPLDYCILTATMGNRARARRLWLKNEVVSSLRLYPKYRANGFARDTIYSLERLRMSPEGDVLVAITTDEQDPAAVHPFPDSESWYYGGEPVTQFWKKPRGTFRRDLHARVNGRFTYWQSQRPIPGGVAFENFELRERFYDGQQFTFGITGRTPQELGWAHE